MLEKTVEPEIEMGPLEEDLDDESEDSNAIDEEIWSDLSLVRKGNLFKGC